MTRNLKKYSDIKGGMDRGPKKYRSHKVEKLGDVMSIASSEVISTHSSNTIKNSASLMRSHDVRRLPVIQAGTHRLEGLVTAVDILDFLGGGEKYNIIERDYGGNFLSAINCPVSKIMRSSQFLDKRASVEDAVDTVLRGRSSCIPIVSGTDDMDVIALVTERDLLPIVDRYNLGVSVGEVMNGNPTTTTLGIMLSDVSKIMVRNQLRRLPVISEDKLVGIVTVFNVLGYLGDGDYKGVDAEKNLSTRADEIIERNVVSVRPEDDLAGVIRLVKDSGYGGFPVAKNNKLVGIITTTDILRWVYK